MDTSSFDNIEKYQKASEEFKIADKQYRIAREKQWRLIREYFSHKEGFFVSLRGKTGHGIPNYTSGKKFLPEYNLSNWRWVEVKHLESRITCLISLQTFDGDSNSGNIHVLFDRIGIYTHVEKKESPYDTFGKMKITDISLPINEE